MQYVYRSMCAASIVTLFLAKGAAAATVPNVMGPLPACKASGQGRDYVVGTQVGQLASLEQVPWDSLKAGDTVRISYRAAPYPSKFLIKGHGTATAPIRVCGIKGPHGERPIITGENALSRPGLVYGTASAGPIHESRAVIIIKGDESNNYKDAPSHIIVDGLSLKSAHPSYTFTNSAGQRKAYMQTGACLWIERGSDITIADNELSDCSNGLFSRSIDDPAAAGATITRNILVSRNYIHDNGIVGSDRMHNSYVQSVHVVYEFNHYGPQRPGALGNALKDRSVLPVVRYNRIEEGAHSIDLVEAEDYSTTAWADPDYGSAFVYGNQIVKNGSTGSVIHFGGDHYDSNPGDAWGEHWFPKGPLLVFHNTIQVTGSGRLFQLSTTEQSGFVWNNIFFFAGSPPYAMLRQTSDVGSSWTPGGNLTLGRNWINSNWGDTDPWHTIPGKVTGASNMITGAVAPFDTTTFIPLANSSVVNAAQPLYATAPPVEWQLDSNLVGVPRILHGTAQDLGAEESDGSGSTGTPPSNPTPPPVTPVTPPPTTCTP